MKSQPIFYTFDGWGKECGWGSGLRGRSASYFRNPQQKFRDARDGPAMIRVAARGRKKEPPDMRFLDNLKISVKILSVIGLLSAVTALVVILGAVSLHGVDQTYSQIAAKEEPAVLALARGARSINIIGYATYRAVAYPGGSPEATAASKSVEANSNNSINFLTEAEQLNPENKDFFEDLLTKTRAINACVAPVVALGLKDQN